MIEGHEGGVKVLVGGNDEYIGSGGLDKKIKIWKRSEEIELCSQLSHHHAAILAMVM